MDLSTLSPDPHPLDMNVPEAAAWLRRALAGEPGPWQFLPGELPAAALASLPQHVTVRQADRMESALTLLLRIFAEQPETWKDAEAKELLSLASLLGSAALPGHRPWGLALGLSLKPLVEWRRDVFEQMPLNRRLSILVLLATGDISIGSNLWEDLGAQPDYRLVAWRGLLRADWTRACAFLPLLLDDARLRYHVRRAVELMQADESGQRRKEMEAALPKAVPAVAELIQKEAAKAGIRMVVRVAFVISAEEFSKAVNAVNKSYKEREEHWRDACTVAFKYRERVPSPELPETLREKILALKPSGVPECSLSPPELTMLATEPIFYRFPDIIRYRMAGEPIFNLTSFLTNSKEYEVIKDYHECMGLSKWTEVL